MRVLVVELERRPEVREIKDSLKAMQGIVGGLIQSIQPFEDSTISLVCNDEGKIMDFPPNRALRDRNGQMYDIVLALPFLMGMGNRL